MMIRGIIIGTFCALLPLNLALADGYKAKMSKAVQMSTSTTRNVVEDKNLDEGHLKEDYDKDAKKKLVFNGTFRYLYGQGRMEGKLLGRPIKEKIILPTYNAGAEYASLT